MITRRFFRLLVFLSITLITLALLATLYKGYHGSIESILSIVNTKKTSEDLSALISAQRFRYIQYLLMAIIIALGLLLWKFKEAYAILASYISSLIQFTRSLFVTAMGSEIKYLLIIPVAGSFYYAIVMPVCYDEGLTYLYFSSKGIFSSISFYPEPNNHVLNSILTNLTIQLPFGVTEFRLRLPSLLVSIITWMLSYRLLNTYYSRQAALIVTAIGSMVFLVFYYSYQSRGYALVNLLFISAFYNALGIIRKNDCLQNWVWFGVSCILGFYTMPSFLYPFLTLNIIILLYNWPNLKRQIITNAVVVMATVVLYLPIIVVNGLDALTNNPYVRSIQRAEVIERLPGFLQFSLNELTQFPWWLVILFLLPAFFYSVLRRQKFSIGLFLIFLLAPVVFLILHSVIPFPRTFIYYGFVLPFLAITGFAEQLKKIPVVPLTIALIAIQLGLLYQFNKEIIPYEERDPQLNWSSKKFTNMMVGDKRYFSSGNLLGTTLLYELKAQGFKKAEVIFYNGPVSADSLKSFDYIIIGHQFDHTKAKKAKITTPYYNIY